MKIEYTRALLNAALDGSLESVDMTQDPIFGFQVPKQVQGIPEAVLNPRRTWPNPGGYDDQARKLATLFEENFKQFENEVSAHVLAAGPVKR